jgi:diguanylate cyclase (GGDEF)-like protein/PAS domain S-box-containing protein
MLAPRPRILAIDDTPANLLTLGAALESEFELQFATSGAMGLALALAEPPDLILLDVMMPEVDGFETLRRIGLHPSLQHIPVVFVTALDDADSEVTGLSLGAADYLAKPIHVSIARQRIRNLMERERLRREVAVQRDLLQEISDQVPGVVYQFRLRPDGSSCFPYASDGLRTIYGLGPDEVREDASPVFSRLHPQDLDAVKASIERSARELTPWVHEYRVCHDNGSVRWVLGNAAPKVEPDGCVLWHGFITDITEHRQDQEKIRVNDLALKAISQGVLITGPDRTILSANQAFTAITGYAEEQIIGQACGFLRGALTDPATVQAMDLAQQSETEFHCEIVNYRSDGKAFWNDLTISPVRNAQGELTQFIGITRDVSERKAMEEQVRQLAFYDVLTKLPNRRLLDDRLQQAIASSRRSACFGALIFLDLDNFKQLNDTHGHDVGDLLLQDVAKRLLACVREVDTVARFGGDEFVLLLGELDSDQELSMAHVQVVARKICAELAAPYDLCIGTRGRADARIEHSCTASLGVSLFSHECRAQDIVKRADAAMYDAKEGGRNRIRFAAPGD